jgi:hypothetical protein
MTYEIGPRVRTTALEFACVVCPLELFGMTIQFEEAKNSTMDCTRASRNGLRDRILSEYLYSENLRSLEPFELLSKSFGYLSSPPAIDRSSLCHTSYSYTLIVHRHKDRATPKPGTPAKNRPSHHHIHR